MRIARLVSSFPEGGALTGGLLPNIYYLSTEEIRQGHETAIFTFGKGDGQEMEGGVCVYRCGQPKLQRLLLGRALLRTIRRTGFRPDVMHSMNAMPLGWLYEPGDARRIGARCVLSVHTPVIQTDPVSLSRRYLLNAEYALLLRKVAARVDLNVAVSRFVKRELVSIGVSEERIQVIPSGLKTDLFSPESMCLATQSDCLYVGRFALIKGLNNLVRAADILARRGKPVRFLLVGGSRSDDGYNALTASIAKHGLEDYFTLMPPVDYKGIHDLYKGCRCFVLPSTREPLGKVVLEAMCSRRPVLASDAGGIRDLVHHGKNGMVFKVGDPASLADRLSEILDDPKLALKLASRGVRFAKDFDWAQVSRMFLEAFESTLGR